MKTKVGHKLLRVREERKISQAEMAEMLGIPLTSYGRIERNEASVELDQLVNISGKLGIGLQDLLPDIIAIHSTNNQKGGGVIFGNQTFNFNIIQSDNSTEIKELIEAIKHSFPRPDGV